MTITGSADGTRGAKLGQDTKKVVGNGKNYPGLNLFGPHRVQMTGGTVEEIGCYDDSRLEIRGGSVGTVRLYGNSKVVVVGGTVKQLIVRGKTQALIYGGSVKQSSVMDKLHFIMHDGNADGVVADGNAPVTLIGGHIVALSGDNTVLRLRGGTVTKLKVNYLASADIFGGEVDSISTSQNPSGYGSVRVWKGTIHEVSTLHVPIQVHGGTIRAGVFRLRSQGCLELYGSQFALTPAGAGKDAFGKYKEYSLSGLLEDGQRADGAIVRDYDGGYEIKNPRSPNGEESPVKFLSTQEKTKTKWDAVIMVVIGGLFTLPALIALLFFTGLSDRLRKRR